MTGSLLFTPNISNNYPVQVVVVDSIAYVLTLEELFLFTIGPVGDPVPGVTYQAEAYPSFSSLAVDTSHKVFLTKDGISTGVIILDASVTPPNKLYEGSIPGMLDGNGALQVFVKGEVAYFLFDYGIVSVTLDIPPTPIASVTLTASPNYCRSMSFAYSGSQAVVGCGASLITVNTDTMSINHTLQLPDPLWTVISKVTASGHKAYIVAKKQNFNYNYLPGEGALRIVDLDTNTLLEGTTAIQDTGPVLINTPSMCVDEEAGTLLVADDNFYIFYVGPPTPAPSPTPAPPPTPSPPPPPTPSPTPIPIVYWLPATCAAVACIVMCCLVKLWLVKADPQYFLGMKRNKRPREYNGEDKQEAPNYVHMPSSTQPAITVVD